MLSNLFEFLTASQCPIWLLILSVLVLFALYAVFYIGAKNRWLASSEQERLISKIELQNVQDKAAQELKCLRSRTAAEINTARNDAEKKIAEIEQQAISEIERVKAECENVIATERELSSEQLRQEREKIVSEKDKLIGLSEKELLVQAVQSLASYASRLDRIEMVVYQLTDNAQQQQNCSNALRANVVTVCDAIETVSPRLEGIATNLQMVSSFNGSLQDDIGKLIALLEEIKHWTEEMQNLDVTDPLHDIFECLETIKEKTDRLQGYSSTTSITEITEIVESIKSTVSDLQGYSSHASLTSIEQALDEIKSALDSRNY